MPVQALNEIVRTYFHLFVNRRAYTVQAARPDPETGRHYYYRPTAKGTGQPLGLTYETLRRHLHQYVPRAVAIGTEKARSELIITPVLLEVLEQFQQPISFFSGVEFNVDGLKEYTTVQVVNVAL